MSEQGGGSPLWSTLRHLARVVLLGAVLGVVMFAVYLGLAVFGI